MNLTLGTLAAYDKGVQSGQAVRNGVQQKRIEWRSSLGNLAAFVAVAQAGGFREAARAGAVSASSLSEAMRRLEARLGVRLLHRTTRSVAPTEAGARLLDRLGPALGEVEAALDVVNGFRDRPAGTLRLNVPASAARLVLPTLVPSFLRACPDDLVLLSSGTQRDRCREAT